MDFQQRLAILQAPLTDEEVEWRIGQVSGKGDGATVLCYPTARTVMDRFDAAFGPAGWQIDGTETRSEWQVRERGKPTEDRYATGYRVGIGVRIVDDATGLDQWIWKWDVCDCSDIEAMKGAWSGAEKRAAVQWGLGRELYRLGTTRVQLKPGWPPLGSSDKAHLKRGEDPKHWTPPTLAEAMGGQQAPPAATPRPPQPAPQAQPPAPPAPPAASPPAATPEPGPASSAGTSAWGAMFHGHRVGDNCPECEKPWPCADHARCPACGGPCWDNRIGKKNPKAPDFKCKDKDSCVSGERQRDHISGWWTNEWIERVNKLVNGEPIDTYCGRSEDVPGGAAAAAAEQPADGDGYDDIPF